MLSVEELTELFECIITIFTGSVMSRQVNFAELFTALQGIEVTLTKLFTIS